MKFLIGFFSCLFVVGAFVYSVGSFDTEVIKSVAEEATEEVKYKYSVHEYDNCYKRTYDPCISAMNEEHNIEDLLGKKNLRVQRQCRKMVAAACGENPAKS